MAIYHNWFIKDLAVIGCPITSLIRKATEFHWSKECDTTLRYIKESLASDPVIKHPNWGRPFILNPTATDAAITTMLMQNDEAKQAHPVYYASRLLTKYEVRYQPTKKLAVSMVFVYTKFKHYMLSSIFPIVVQCE